MIYCLVGQRHVSIPDLPSLRHFVWFSHLSLYSYPFMGIFPNVTQFHNFSFISLITNVNLFYRIHSYRSMPNNIQFMLLRDYFCVKNGHHLHGQKSIFCIHKNAKLIFMQFSCKWIAKYLKIWIVSLCW